jgi:hypothetical protein
VVKVFKFVWRLRWKINVVCMSLSPFICFQPRFVTNLLTFPLTFGSFIWVECYGRTMWDFEYSYGDRPSETGKLHSGKGGMKHKHKTSVWYCFNHIWIVRDIYSGSNTTGLLMLYFLSFILVLAHMVMMKMMVIWSGMIYDVIWHVVLWYFIWYILEYIIWYLMIWYIWCDIYICDMIRYDMIYYIIWYSIWDSGSS